MSGNDQLLSSGSGTINAGSGISSANHINALQECGSAPYEPNQCCESEADGRPTESNDGDKYPITIHHLNFGYNVKVGCQNFAVETVEKLIKNLEAYLKDPSGTTRLWMREKKLL